MKKLLFLIAFFFLINMAWAGPDDPPEELKKLLTIEQKKTSKKTKRDNTLRLKSMREGAQALGAEGGFQYQYDKIWESLETIIPQLDKIYNFEGYLMYRGKILPAIISEGGPAERLENYKQATSSQKTFQIIKESEIITAKPNWRTYLSKPNHRPISIHKSLYPMTKEEKTVWKEEIKNGWEMGLKQADYIFQVSLNELTRDITGLIRFRRLALQKIVATPILATGKSDVDITEHGKKLQIGKTVYRLTNDSTFENAENWTIKTALEGRINPKEPESLFD